MLARHTAPSDELPAVAARRTVLVLQQDEVLREAVTRWLEADGFAVHATVDGRDAAAWLAGHPTAVMVVDRIYPGWDGLGTLGAARGLRPELRVLVVDRGGELDGFFTPMARSVGADAVIGPTVRRTDLLEAVRRLGG